MDFKALFFDIDWTLFDHAAKAYVPSGIEAIKKAKKKGIKVFLCSSRPYDSMVTFGAFDLGIEWDGYVSSCGGVAYTDGKYVRKTLIKSSDLHRFDRLAHKLGLTYELVGPTSRHLAYAPTVYMHRFRELYKDGEVPVYRYRGEEVVGILMFAPNHYDSLFKERLSSFTYYRFHDYGVEISEVPHKKGDGIKAILRYHNIDPALAAGFGDDTQDLTMKEGLCTLVAMGNGKEELKKGADLVTARIDEDGLLKAFLQLGIIV